MARAALALAVEQANIDAYHSVHAASCRHLRDGESVMCEVSREAVAEAMEGLAFESFEDVIAMLKPCARHMFAEARLI